MKLQILDKESMDWFASNLSKLTPFFLQDNNHWIEELLGHSPLVNTKYDVPDFELEMTDEAKPESTDFENVKRVYGNLMFLTDSQASDERLWAGLCLGQFWKYTQWRWKIKSKCTESNIKGHFFFGYGPRRSLTRNALARLWWVGRLTYDETNLVDPYVYTRFICEHNDYIMHVLERNTSNNPEIIRPFLQAIIDSEKEGLKINTDAVGELSKYLNLLGGTYILDCLSEKTIHEKILSYARSKYSTQAQ